MIEKTFECENCGMEFYDGETYAEFYSGEDKQCHYLCIDCADEEAQGHIHRHMNCEITFHINEDNYDWDDQDD